MAFCKGTQKEIECSSPRRAEENDALIYYVNFRKQGYVKAIVDFALKREDLKEETGTYLRHFSF
jgi:hypothetical protein